MKTKLVMLFIIAMMTAKSQNKIDSLKYFSDKIKQEQLKQQSVLIKQNPLPDIQMNLLKCHKQYKKGVNTMLVGLSISALGTLVGIANDEPQMGLVMGGIGSGFMLIGGVIMIDSHKYIGRAGKVGQEQITTTK